MAASKRQEETRTWTTEEREALAKTKARARPSVPRGEIIARLEQAVRDPGNAALIVRRLLERLKG